MHEYGIAVATVVGLFLLGVVSPGPNFLIVVERSMSSGFRARCSDVLATNWHARRFRLVF